ncbi:MAG: hypothetical protein WBD24_03680 [Candidatus Omnitrophota bacterium]
MKKTILFFVIGILVVSQIAFAHPPSEIDAKFDHTTKTLTVHIRHFVINPNRHFIKEVTIDLNDTRKVFVEEFDKQGNNFGFSVSFKLPQARPGDTITVTAACSRIGSLSKKFEI